MADMMQFDLVSPERSLASFEVTEVQIPGAEGDLTAMPSHTPTLTTLRPGMLSAISTDGSHDFLVTGGFAEITAAGVTILAEQAVAKSDVTQDDMDDMLAASKAAVDAAPEDAVDAANKTHADVVALAGTLGLSGS